MKLKTSFFNATAFKKNLTRFSPVWGLYIVCLLMGMFLLTNSGISYGFYTDLCHLIEVMPVINFCYAVLCAQLLFGDLYNARMCNMLHALPIRREGWYLTHVASGLVFSAVPTAIMALVAMSLSFGSYMVNAWQIPLLWWAATNLQFLFFFGIACLCALLVGSRVAQALVYGIVNLFAMLLYWIVDTLFAPLYYGIRTDLDIFSWFSPLVQMINLDYIDCNREEIFTGYDATGIADYTYHAYFEFRSEGWHYLAVCAVVALLALAIGLQLYRSRKMEAAGDFMAVRPLEPVFQVVYTICVGVVFYFVVEDMFGYSSGLLFLVVGMVVGFFTGRMFLERNVRVFSRKNWISWAVLVAACLSLVGIAALDPFGWVKWMPKLEEVESVTVASGWYTYHESEITLTDPADIQAIIDAHQEELEEFRATGSGTAFIVEPVTVEATTPAMAVDREVTREEHYGNYNAEIMFTYHMKNGSVKHRYYYIRVGSEGGQAIRSFFSRVECVFGDANPDPEKLAKSVDGWGFHNDLISVLFEEEKDLTGLVEAMIADCEAGTMTQDYSFDRWDYHVASLSWLEETEIPDVVRNREISFDSGDVNCMQWLRDQGIDVDALLAEEYEGYAEKTRTSIGLG